MIKNIIKIFVVLGITAIAFCSMPVLAQDDEVTKSVDVSVLSRYVWRGYTLSDDSYVIQPSVTFAYNGFAFNVWGNIDSSSKANPTTYGKSDWNETDITLSYDWSYDKLSFGVGYILYYLDGGTDTNEIYYTIGYDTILSPTLSVYYDFDAIEGAYTQLGVSHSFEIAGDITLDLSGSISYYAAKKLYEYDVNGNALDGSTLVPSSTSGLSYFTKKSYAALHDGNITASMTIPVYNNISITPSISYTTALSDKAENHISGSSVVYEKDQVYGGVTISYTF